jgi:hypothetical protein
MILILPSKPWRENGNRCKKDQIISGHDYLNALACINPDFFTLNSIYVTVRSVPFFPLNPFAFPHENWRKV